MNLTQIKNIIANLVHSTEFINMCLDNMSKGNCYLDILCDYKFRKRSRMRIFE